MKPNITHRMVLFSTQALLVGMLVAILILLLSLWWLGAGWSNGQAAAATALTVILWYVIGEFVRRRFQISLKSLMICVAVIAVACGMFSKKLIEARKQEMAVGKIVRLGGSVDYDYQSDSGEWFQTSTGVSIPRWLRTIVGDGMFATVECVNLHGSNVTDANVVQLDLDKFPAIALSNTPITDHGLANLAGLTNLEVLRLDSTQITDAGLAHLESLSKLQVLFVKNTNVTPGGVKKLQQSLPNCRIVR